MRGWRLLPNAGKCGLGRAFLARRSLQSYSWKFVPERALADPCPSLQRSIGVHVFHAVDQLGIVANISQMIARWGANVLNVDIHIDFDNGVPVFYSRSPGTRDARSGAEIGDISGEEWPRDAMNEDFAAIGRKFNAQTSVVRLPKLDEKLKTVVVASRQEDLNSSGTDASKARFGFRELATRQPDHCLVDLMHRWQEGQLPADIRAVISNHPRGPNTHVVRFLDRHGIPYHYLPTTKDDNKEEEILEVVKDTDFLILARYMQVLSGEFLTKYGRDVINIHHGLLPSFKGANPYRQAYRAGVKLIGATSHFVTEELDDGPIIEQMVERVSHRDTVHSFAMKSENLEKQCLAKAIKYYCEHRIIRYSKNKTIIFY